MSSDMTELASLLNRGREAWDQDLEARYPFMASVAGGRMAAIVYPTARLGRRAASALTRDGIRVVGFGDRSERLQGTIVDGLPVLSPEEVAERHADDAILVASALHDSAIIRAMTERGCRNVASVGYLNRAFPSAFSLREYDRAAALVLDPANRATITAVYELLADEESRSVFVSKLEFYLGLDKRCIDRIHTTAPIYFDPSVYRLRTDEVVVDGGAFTGDTLQALRAATGGEFRRYIAFEPDASNFANLTATAGRDAHRVDIVEAGLSDQAGEVRFLLAEAADSRILGADEAGGSLVRVVALDDYLADGPAPTLIKLDIEGAEAAALHGASKTIARHDPVLAISAYHYPSDLWTIPWLLHELAPLSGLYLRHYTPEVDDTVCYAVPPARLLTSPSRPEIESL